MIDSNEESATIEDTSHVHHSPESAGIVRGLSKSSKVITKLRRPQIKIKPKLRTPKPKATPKLKTPSPPIPKSPRATTSTVATKSGKNITLKNVGSRVKNSKSIANKTNGGNLKNNVAKISDRASKGVDIVSSFDETLVSDSNNGESNTKKRNIFQKILFQKTAIVHFVSNLLQHTILGAFVFATYEECIERFDGIDITKTGAHDNKIDDAFANVTVTKHFLSGGIAGSLYGFLTTAIESIKLYPAATIQMPSTLSFASSIFHNCTSHAILFGSYESFKRLLLYHFTQKTYLDLSYQDENKYTWTGNTSNDDRDDSSLKSPFLFTSLSAKQLLCISIAGGISGSMQHIFSHYTEKLILRYNHFKVLDSVNMGSSNANPLQENNPVRGSTPHLTTEKSCSIPSSIRLFDSLSKMKLPPMRPLFFIFPMNAIGFIAFEYGRDIVASSKE